MKKSQVKMNAPAAAEDDILKQLADAFEVRDQVAQTFGATPEQIEEEDKKIQKLVMQLTAVEAFDAHEQPVLYALSDMAQRRNALAVRLLMQPRTRIRLHQNPPNEKPKDDVAVGINGLMVVCPRGRQLEVPESISDILASLED